MSIELRMPSSIYTDMVQDFGRIPDKEQVVFCLAGEAHGNGESKFLARDLYLVPENEYVSHSSSHFEVKESFLGMLIKGALIDGNSVMMAHIHPFAKGDAWFSSIDDAYEPKLLRYIRDVLPDASFICLVSHPNGTWAARVYKPGSFVPVPIDKFTVVGRPTFHIAPTNASHANSKPIPEVFERQVRALGKDSYGLLKQLRVGVIGLGGTGSIVNQQLAHLGVGTIIQVDPDCLEESNLSRVVGSTRADIGQPKVTIAKRIADSTAGGTHSVPIALPLDIMDAFEELKMVDALFCCTDSVSSRRLANLLSVQYGIPLFDMGVSLKGDEKGRLQFANSDFRPVFPTEPCLECMGAIDYQRILLEVQEMQEGGYLEGEKEPSVITFNSVIASLAVTDFLSVFTGFTQYDSETAMIHSILDGSISTVQMSIKADCICQSVQGMGDSAQYPVRQRSDL